MPSGLLVTSQLPVEESQVTADWHSEGIGHVFIDACPVQAPLTHQSFNVQAFPSLQLLKSCRLPMSTQTDVPEAQDVFPAWQGLPEGAQSTLSTHMVQTPPRQRSFVPQNVPSGLGLLPQTPWAQEPVSQTSPLHLGMVPRQLPSAWHVPEV